MKHEHNDGGRAAAGFSGKAGDCVVRAVAIATKQDYRTVYDALSAGCRSERKTKGAQAKASARNGVKTQRAWFHDYMERLGWTWTPTMGIGTGCKVHLREGELPMGRIIAAVSRHYVALIDGVAQDTHDCTRGGTRCVYGYWENATDRAIESMQFQPSQT